MMVNHKAIVGSRLTKLNKVTERWKLKLNLKMEGFGQ